MKTVLMCQKGGTEKQLSQSSFCELFIGSLEVSVDTDHFVEWRCLSTLKPGYRFNPPAFLILCLLPVSGWYLSYLPSGRGVTLAPPLSSFLFFFPIYFYQLEANYFTILQWFLPYIDMNQPWIYMCSPSQSPLLPPSLSHPLDKEAMVHIHNGIFLSSCSRLVEGLIPHWLSLHSRIQCRLARKHRPGFEFEFHVFTDDLGNCEPGQL